MENAQIELTPTPTENLTGGADLLVTYQDGKTETVHCRIRKVSEIQKGLSLIGDEEAMTAWLFDKPKEWSDTLTMHSFNEAVELSNRVNADFFVALIRRGEKGAGLLKVLNPTEYQKLFAGAAQSGASSTSFRKPK